MSQRAAGDDGPTEKAGVPSTSGASPGARPKSASPTSRGSSSVDDDNLSVISQDTVPLDFFASQPSQDDGRRHQKQDKAGGAPADPNAAQDVRGAVFDAADSARAAPQQATAGTSGTGGVSSVAGGLQRVGAGSSAPLQGGHISAVSAPSTAPTLAPALSTTIYPSMAAAAVAAAMGLHGGKPVQPTPSSHVSMGLSQQGHSGLSASLAHFARPSLVGSLRTGAAVAGTAPASGQPGHPPPRSQSSSPAPGVGASGPTSTSTTPTQPSPTIVPKRPGGHSSSFLASATLASGAHDGSGSLLSPPFPPSSLSRVISGSGAAPGASGLSGSFGGSSSGSSSGLSGASALSLTALPLGSATRPLSLGGGPQLSNPLFARTGTGSSAGLGSGIPSYSSAYGLQLGSQGQAGSGGAGLAASGLAPSVVPATSFSAMTSIAALGAQFGASPLHPAIGMQASHVLHPPQLSPRSSRSGLSGASALAPARSAGSDPSASVTPQQSPLQHAASGQAALGDLSRALSRGSSLGGSGGLFLLPKAEGHFLRDPADILISGMGSSQSRRPGASGLTPAGATSASPAVVPAMGDTGTALSKSLSGSFHLRPALSGGPHSMLSPGSFGASGDGSGMHVGSALNPLTHSPARPRPSPSHSPSPGHPPRAAEAAAGGGVQRFDSLGHMMSFMNLHPSQLVPAPSGPAVAALNPSSYMARLAVASTRGDTIPAAISLPRGDSLFNFLQSNLGAGGDGAGGSSGGADSYFLESDDGIESGDDADETAALDPDDPLLAEQAETGAGAGTRRSRRFLGSGSTRSAGDGSGGTVGKGRDGAGASQDRDEEGASGVIMVDGASQLASQDSVGDGLEAGRVLPVKRRRARTSVLEYIRRGGDRSEPPWKRRRTEEVCEAITMLVGRGRQPLGTLGVGDYATAAAGSLLGKQGIPILRRGENSEPAGSGDKAATTDADSIDAKGIQRCLLLLKTIPLTPPGALVPLLPQEGPSETAVRDCEAFAARNRVAVKRVYDDAVETLRKEEQLQDLSKGRPASAAAAAAAAGSDAASGADPTNAGAASKEEGPAQLREQITLLGNILRAPRRTDIGGTAHPSTHEKLRGIQVMYWPGPMHAFPTNPQKPALLYHFTALESVSN
jgi:hypothetical protein